MTTTRASLIRTLLFAAATALLLFAADGLSAPSPVWAANCQDADACLGKTGAVGDPACNGVSACELQIGDVGDNSCIGSQACRLQDGGVGDGSCNGDDACGAADAPIGDGSCNGQVACDATAASSVGNHSCNGPDNEPQCDGSSGVSGDVDDCEHNHPDFVPAACEGGHLEVRKFLWPLNDSGRFNLWIDGEKEASNVGNGGTTGEVEVEPGTHPVRETGSFLSRYIISMTCRDEDGTGDVVFYGIGPGPHLVPVEAGEDVVCVVRNVRRPGR